MRVIVGLAALKERIPFVEVGENRVCGIVRPTGRCPVCDKRVHAVFRNRTGVPEIFEIGVDLGQAAHRQY